MPNSTLSPIPRYSELTQMLEDEFNEHTYATWASRDYGKHHADNRGYNTLYGIADVQRSFWGDHYVGRAASSGNWAWNVEGVKYAWYMPTNGWDNIIQHETSHNFGLSDRSTNDVMNDPECVEEDWDNWHTKDKSTIENRKKYLAQAPT